MNKAGLLLVVAIAGLVLILSLLAFFTYAPIFSTFCYVFLYIMYIYFTSEQTSRFHQAQENENRFWTILALLFSTTMLFTKDSPLALGLYSPTSGFILIIVFTYAVHTYDRYVHRVQMGTTNFIRKNRTTMLLCNSSEEVRQSAQDTVAVVRKLAEAIDSFIVPSTVNNYLFRNYVMDVEKRIIALFREASPDTLNFMVHRVRLGLIFYKIKNHPVEGGDHRTQLVELMVYDRISVLSISARALVLDALQKMYLTAHSKSEQYVRAILLATRGDDLSQLKSITDAKGDFHSLHKLIYNDIKNKSIQRDILEHIKKEAGVQAAHMLLGTKRSKERKSFAWRKILSDVDDTLTCSAGRYPAGIDNRYPKKAIYPGVIGFYRELDLGTNGTEEWRYGRVGNLCFLSARPHVYKDLSEKHSYQKFKKLIETRGLHTPPTLLAGSLESGGQFMLQGKMEGLAVKKFENFEQYLALYPEFKHIFIADNGQGDVRAAEMMIEKYGNGVVQAVFIHKVQPLQKTYGWNETAKERWDNMNIHFFDDYIHAAHDAFQQGLIRPVSFHRIANEAKADFEHIARWKSSRGREFRRAELNKPLEKFRDFWEFHNLPAVKPMLHVAVYPKGTHVVTPFGYGIVRDFRERTNTYKVELWWGPTPDPLTESKVERAGSNANLLGGSPVKGLRNDEPVTPSKVLESPKLAATVSAPSSSTLSAGQLEEGNQSPPLLTRKPQSQFKPIAYLQLDQLWEPNEAPATNIFGVPFTKQKIPSKIVRKQLRQKPLYRPKEAVLTPYGLGRIKSVRTVQVDATSIAFMYRVSLEWGNPDAKSALGVQQEASSSGASTPSLTGQKPISAASATVAGAAAGGRGAEGTLVVASRPVMEPVAYLNEACLEPAPVTVDKHGYYILSPHMLGLLLRGGRRQRVESSASDQKGPKPTSPLPKEELLQPGTLVTTSFGAGFVLCHREDDGILEIQLAWELANNRYVTAYMHRKDVKPDIQMEGQRRESFFSFLRRISPKSSQASLSTLDTDAAASQNLKFSEGALVNTPFGKARVIRHREKDVIVEVEFTAWALANGHRPLGYFNPADLKLEHQPSKAMTSSVFGLLRSLTSWTPRGPTGKVPSLAQGALVQTHMGPAHVVCHRLKDDIVEVELRWQLAQGQLARGYFHRASLKVLPRPRSRSDSTALSPGGRQKKKTRMFDFLFPSSLNIGKPALSTLFDPGTCLQTPFGDGVVVIHREDDIVEVELSWHLANGKPVKAYLRPASVVSRARTLSAMSPRQKSEDSASRGGLSLFSSLLTLGRKNPRPQDLPKDAFVTTPFGDGKIADIRESDGMVVVDLFWVLSNQQPARAFLRPEDVQVCIHGEQMVGSLKRQHPETGQKSGVLSYLSFGLISSAASKDLTPQISKREHFVPDEMINTQYGPAQVIKQRSSDQIVIVKLLNWNLAGGSCAMAFLHPNGIKEVQIQNHDEQLVGSSKLQDSETGQTSGMLSYLSFGLISSAASKGHDLSPQSSRRKSFVPGMMINTQYGPARVIKQRSSDQIVIVELFNWNLARGNCATAFLHPDGIEEGNILKNEEAQVLSLSNEPTMAMNRSFLSLITLGYWGSKKNIYLAQGSLVKTAFGAGRVIVHRQSDNIIEVELTSWSLTNGCFPIAYLNTESVDVEVDTAPSLDTSNFSETTEVPTADSATERNSSGVFSFLRIPYLTSRRSKENTQSELEEPTYPIKSFVNTPYGIARIISFRHSDQMYKVKMANWAAVAYMHEKRLNICMKASIGSRVRTTFGTGIVEDVRNDSVHVIRSQQPVSLQFLQPTEIVKEIPVVVGDNVKTAYGQGTVAGYRARDDMYIITLHHIGKDAWLYCTRDALERIDPSELMKFNTGNSRSGIGRFLNFRLFVVQ